MSTKRKLFISLSVLLILIPTISFTGSVNYVYDDNNRLIRVVGESGTEIEYQYDEVGNRLAVTAPFIVSIGVLRDGWWYLDSNGNHVWEAGVDEKFKFGIAGDQPVAGDWNGDGISDIGVLRDGWWYLDSNGNHVWEA
jgi:YD repeat-containing protein